MAVVIAIAGSEDHAKKLAAKLDAELISPEVRQFPDGELYVRIDHDLTGRDVILVGSLYPRPAEKFLAVAFLAATARDLGAKRVGLVAPYLAFMRQDVRFKAGEGVTSRYFAQLVSGTVDWMVTVDPHLHRHAALEGLYSIPTSIARSAPEIARWVAAEVERPMLIGPDAESAQWVSAVAAGCGAPFVILEKTRRGDRDVSISSPLVSQGHTLDGHTPVLIDDIVSTGKTMIEATRQLRAAGAAPPMCVAIHAVFADNVLDDLTSAGAAGIITCDTIVHASNRICVADPIAEAAKHHLR
ncbi:MAG: ribose-phosphate pyrophosphokinae [Myxococcales bacterium]|nr:ribose-phosphate pyrophosphokinae [Myxococcales bacterium]